MAILGMNSSLLACALALLISGADAFAPGAKHFAIVTKVGPRVRTPFFMAEQNDDSNEQITITSGKKEIAYDEKAGRFFETNLDEGECIPEDEYCVIDEKTGQMIRLTIQEKERIFLDAIQVRAIDRHCQRLGLRFNFFLKCSPSIPRAVIVVILCHWQADAQR